MTTIERLRALLAEATPGPWKFVEPHSVMAPLPARFGYATIPVAAIDGLFSKRHRNGALIAAAVNALPKVLDELEHRREAMRIETWCPVCEGTRCKFDEPES